MDDSSNVVPIGPVLDASVQKLIAFQRERRLTASAIARLLGISRSTFEPVLKGERAPSADMAARIQTVLLGGTCEGFGAPRQASEFDPTTLQFMDRIVEMAGKRGREIVPHLTRMLLDARTDPGFATSVARSLIQMWMVHIEPKDRLDLLLKLHDIVVPPKDADDGIE